MILVNSMFHTWSLGRSDGYGGGNGLLQPLLLSPTKWQDSLAMFPQLNNVLLIHDS